MMIFQSPVAVVLFVLAAILMILSMFFDKPRILQYIGGAIFAAGVIVALVNRAGIKETVIAALIFLLIYVLGTVRSRKK